MFGQKRRRSSIMRMIDVADTDNNQKVDFEEFVLLMKDADRDGSIQRATVEKKKMEGDNKVDLKKAEQELKKRLGRPNLSRDDLNASVYGNLSAVRIEETPQFVAAKTKEFDTILESTAAAKKANVTLAKEKVPEQLDDRHKLMFLRAELFEAAKAVDRCCRHWDFVLDIFGPEKAFLPLTQEGALRDDLEILKLPVLNDTLMKDDFGQHVLFLDKRSVALTKYEARALCRATFYTFQNRLEEDEEAQKNGVVVQILTPTSPTTWNIKFAKKMLSWVRQGAPVRLACAHMMYPAPFFSIMFRVTRILAGELSSRLKIFGGSESEVMENMKKFGLDRDRIVKNLGGTLVLEREQWLQERADAGK
uniref:EF-hand domain-containing protein n=1 Tax=Cyclophora tenuis TaxID=216820 RepID=A0A7S1D817_CYCTE|mmetsp:Transcript_3637/g.6205  ORF Transcript_3637/g.6205 Transcript_3637/m.6205 type:complete len:363 (+) Transcript_3637:656-1744(+)